MTEFNEILTWYGGFGIGSGLLLAFEHWGLRVFDKEFHVTSNYIIGSATCFLGAVLATAGLVNFTGFTVSKENVGWIALGWLIVWAFAGLFDGLAYLIDWTISQRIKRGSNVQASDISPEQP